MPTQQKKKRLDSTAFRLQMEAVPIPVDGGLLYALYGDPNQLERGGHPYWLVSVRKNPYQAPQGLKDVQGKTIAIRNWVVDAVWYTCVSDDPNHKAYEMLLGVPCKVGSCQSSDTLCKKTPACRGVIHVRLSSFVTEVGLEWAHYSCGRQGTRDTGIFADASHLAVMRHNFSNVV